MKLLKKTLCFMSILFLISLMPKAAYASESLDKMKPIHSYTFDNDTSTTILDSGSGTIYNGTNTGTTLITGYNGTGYARHFNGASFIAFNNKIIPTGKKTISFMIKASSTPTVQYFVLGNYATTATQNGIRASISPNGTIVVTSNSAGTICDVRSSINICDNEWHKILYTWDGTTQSMTAKLYVDDMSTPNMITTSTFKEVNSASLNLYIGTITNGSSTYALNFTGDYDNFYVYDFMYLNQPTSVTGTAIQVSKQSNISWGEVPGSIKYNIYRSETSGKGYVYIGSSNTTSYEDADTALRYDKAYYYVVTAANSDFESDYSNEVSVTIEEDGSNAILNIYMDNGTLKEYNLTGAELQDFLTWYDTRSIGSAKAYYTFTVKGTIAPFNSVKNYIPYDKILYFDVKKYNK